MRCSICDAKKSRYVFGHFHCARCEEIIRVTIGKLNKDDVEHIVLGVDDDLEKFTGS